MPIDRAKQIHDFIAESRRQSFERDQVEPSTSGRKQQPREVSQHRQQVKTAEERANDLVREAEAAKAKIYRPTGRLHGENTEYYKHDRCNHGISLESNFVHSAMVDENYLIVVGHIDETMQCKIEQGQYVDFARLIP